jgi:Zn-dependent protease with chaperone function
MATNVPAPRPRRTYPQIAPVTWEHPADRAALQTLRAIPGVDDVIRKILSLLGGERGVRLLFQGGAVRVGPTQFPRLWQMHVEMCATFDWEHVPELYVTQTPVFNAGAYGIDDPFIVLHSAALELLDDDEIRALLAHELGHVMSGHALYATIAAILALVSLGALPFLAGIAILPIKLAFLEWSRKSELTADRAALLGAQDPIVVQRKFLKMAGGGRGEWFTAADLNTEAFMAQAHEYAQSNEGLDLVYKFINTVGLTHPLATVRAGEIQKWITSGDYDRILRGEYVKRGTPEADRPLRDHAREAKDYYKEEIRDMGQKVGAAAKQAADNIREAFNNARSKSGA